MTRFFIPLLRPVEEKDLESSAQNLPKFCVLLGLGECPKLLSNHFPFSRRHRSSLPFEGKRKVLLPLPPSTQNLSGASFLTPQERTFLSLHPQSERVPKNEVGFSLLCCSCHFKKWDRTKTYSTVRTVTTHKRRQLRRRHVNMVYTKRSEIVSYESWETLTASEKSMLPIYGWQERPEGEGASRNFFSPLK